MEILKELFLCRYGKKKGCAYVEFESESSAKKAVFKVDQMEFMGKTLTVAISQPPSTNQSKAPQNPASSGSSHSSSSNTKMLPRTEQKSRISFIPAAVQKSNLMPPPAANKPLSNDDFRKLMSK